MSVSVRIRTITFIALLATLAITLISGYITHIHDYHVDPSEPIADRVNYVEYGGWPLPYRTYMDGGLRGGDMSTSSYSFAIDYIFIFVFVFYILLLTLKKDAVRLKVWLLIPVSLAIMFGFFVFLVL